MVRAIDDLNEDLLAEWFPASIRRRDDDTQIRYVTWDAQSLLGRKPTASESASISRALRELTAQSPAPVTRRRRPGEKRKRLIRLTAAGKYRYRLLRMAAVLTDRSIRKTPPIR